MRNDESQELPGAAATPTPASAQALLGLVIIGAAVSFGLGLYGKLHTPTGHPLTTLGFPDLPAMKAWLSTAAFALGFVQVASALRMFGRIGHGPAPRAVVLTHRLSGLAAVLLTIPVASQCLWALGFASYSPRVLAHSLTGCLFYGVFVIKMLSLRSTRVPGWALPALGGTLFAVLVLIWATSAAWYFGA